MLKIIKKSLEEIQEIEIKIKNLSNAEFELNCELDGLSEIIKRFEDIKIYQAVFKTREEFLHELDLIKKQKYLYESDFETKQEEKNNIENEIASLLTREEDLLILLSKIDPDYCENIRSISYE